MSLVLFHPRVSPAAPVAGLHTLGEMRAAHKDRQARFAAASASEAARLRGIREEARAIREWNEKAAAEDARAREERYRAHCESVPIIGCGPTVRKIILTVAQAYGVTPLDMMSARRTAGVVLPRQIAMYLARVTTLRSMPDIGRQFGGKDHTTILHAVRKISARMAVDDDFREKVEALRADLTQP